MFLSPFSATQSKDHPGLVGIKNAIVTINWGDLARMWSHSTSAGITINSITVTFSKVQMLVAFLTPKPHLRPSLTNQYDYTNIEYFPQPSISIANTASATISAQNIQLQAVPNKIILYCRKSDSLRTFNDPDSYLSINSVNIIYMNKSGILATAQPQQLYNISRRNGLDSMNYTNWLGNPVQDFAGGLYHPCGSIVVLDPSFDFGLGDDLADGVNVQNQFLVTINVTNNTGADISSMTFYIITLTDGVMTIDNGNVTTQVGCLSKQDVYDARQNMNPYIDYNDLEFADSTYSGGSLKSFFKERVGPWLKDNWKPLLKKGFELAPKLIEMIPGGHDGGLTTGGVFVGGKKMTRAELKKYMK